MDHYLYRRRGPLGTRRTKRNPIPGAQSNPDADVATDDNDQCYVTGNGGGAAATYDVDNGIVTLTSPARARLDTMAAELSFYYWFPPVDQTHRTTSWS
ncbi:MAG: hypothetical protein R2792_18360 [Saprospiraceae bacterium]